MLVLKVRTDMFWQLASATHMGGKIGFELLAVSIGEVEGIERPQEVAPLEGALFTASSCSSPRVRKASSDS